MKSRRRWIFPNTKTDWPVSWRRWATPWRWSALTTKPKGWCPSVQALYFQDKRASVKRVPLPVIPEGHALVRVIASGICSTDLHLLRGYYDFKGVPGHEFVGRVEGPAGSV